MGFTPRDVDAMSAWEFGWCLDGWAEANGAKRDKGGPEMSDERLRELGIEGF